MQDEMAAQGAMYLMHELQTYLAEIAGFAAVSLQPAAGAQGEFTGILIMRAYHADRGDIKRTKMLIPDSAHGTNPASSAMAGLTSSRFHRMRAAMSISRRSRRNWTTPCAA